MHVAVAVAVGGGSIALARLLYSALPEVDDFDRLFAVIVRGKRESGFFLLRMMMARWLPMTKLALFRAT